MKETTPTNLLTGQWGATLDYVCTHKPVKIVADNRHDVVMVLATDYLGMVNEIEQLNNPWISVDDRLPKVDQEVLIQIPVAGHVNIESARYIWDGEFLGCWCDRRGKEHSYKVTHWMPLPCAH